MRKFLLGFILLALLGTAAGFWVVQNSLDETDPGGTEETVETATTSDPLKGTTDASILTADDLSQETTDVFSYVTTVNVVPDDQYQTGGFCRLTYSEESESFYATFGGLKVDQTLDESKPFGYEAGSGYAYKEYSLDLEPTGKEATFFENGTDSNSISVVENGKTYYYFLIGSVPHDGQDGWNLIKYDPATWEVVDEVWMGLNYDPTDQIMEVGGEAPNDQILGYGNGYLLPGDLYRVTEAEEGGPDVGEATFYNLHDTDLNFVEKVVLQDVPHINGGSIIFANGAYQVVSSTSFFGDLVVMQYDEDWNFLDSKTLTENGQWAQGLVYDEQTELYYVSYVNHVGPTNVHLAAYDKNWDLVSYTRITDFNEGDDIIKVGGRPFLFLKDDRLFVTYDIQTRATNGEDDRNWQCYATEYSL